MALTPDFLFDFGSPNAYFAHRLIPGIERRTNSRFRYVPILLGGLFRLSGNQAPSLALAGVPNKIAYELRDMERFIARHNMAEYRWNPHFPVNTLALMRCAVAAQDIGVFDAYVEAVFHFMWEKPCKLDDMEVLGITLAEAGLPARDLLALSEERTVKDRLIANTQDAFERGAFGVPSFLVGGELYFGKDRMAEVEFHLIVENPRHLTPVKPKTERN